RIKTRFCAEALTRLRFSKHPVRGFTAACDGWAFAEGLGCVLGNRAGNNRSVISDIRGNQWLHSSSKHRELGVCSGGVLGVLERAMVAKRRRFGVSSRRARWISDGGLCLLQFSLY